MSLTEQGSGNGPGGPPPAAPEPGSARRRGRFRWWRLLPPAGLAATAAIILAVLAATYQPITFGATSGIGRFPGLPQGSGLRWVNNFGGFSADLYIPPQSGTFTIIASIDNNGTHAVTIEGVTLLRVGGRFWPLTPAGPVRYYRMQGGPRQPTVHLLHNVTLGPGEEIEIGIPARMADPCSMKDGWVEVDGFFVRERFLSFTHTVSLPFTGQGGRLIVDSPAGRHSPGAVCPSQ